MQQPPWDKLGINVQNVAPPKVLRAAGLNWHVVKRPLYATLEHQQIPIPGREILIRESDGRPLSVVSPNWHPTQNDAAFELFTQLVERGGMKMTYAGALKKGRMVWGLAKTPWHFTVGGERVETHMLLTNPHEYGRSIDARFVALMPDMSSIVIPLDSGALFTTHRSKLSPEIIERTAKELKLTHNWLEEHAKRLSTKTLDAPKFFQTVFGSIRPAQVAGDDMTASNKNTAWQAVRSTAHAIDLKLGYSPDTRLTSAWYGVNRARKERALRLAMELTA